MSARRSSSNGWVNYKRQQLARQRQREWQDELGRDREWWGREAVRTKTDWSSLLRQRIRVLGWVRAGRPSISEYMRTRRLAGGRDDE